MPSRRTSKSAPRSNRSSASKHRTAPRRSSPVRSARSTRSGAAGRPRSTGTRARSATATAAGPRPIRFAVVGLGHIAQNAVLPAFAHARREATLAALVSDDPTKLRTLGRRYRVERTYSYDQYEECLRSGAIDAVYITLPNHLHREYTEAAARAGVHVLCEKPMAVTRADCEAMRKAADAADVRLMIAYRLHFERANLEAIEIARSGKLGELRAFSSVFTMQVKAGDIRLRRETGGGTLYDIGIYCINAARGLFAAEPMEVFAFSTNSGEPRFREVDESSGAVLTFPGARLATFVTSFGAADRAWYEIVGTEGSLRVEDGYEYAKEIRHVLTRGGRTRERTFPKRDQFAPELVHFAQCVRTGRDPEPSGLEGAIDVELIEALYRSAETGKPVPYEGPERRRRPSMAQELDKPAVREEPELVHAESPTRGD